MREIRVEIDGTSRSTVTRHVTALDETGARSIAQQLFSYDADRQVLAIKDAATLKSDGRILSVDPRAIADQPTATNVQAPVFSNQRVRMVAFPDVGATDTVRVVAETELLKPRVPGQFTWSEYYPASYGPGESSLTLDVPAALDLHVDADGVTIDREERDDRVVYRFVRTHHTPDDATPGLSPTHGSPHVHVSTARSYGELLHHLAQRNREAASVTPAIAEKARQIVAGIDGREERARRIVNWVSANIRYVMMAFGEGGYVSEPADTTLAMRYGDCKAHAILLKALLAEVGIASEPVVVNSSVARFDLPRIPTLSFDHMILYIADLDRYVDPTSSTAGFDGLPASLPGKPVVHLESVRISRIPVATAADNVFSAEADIRLFVDGSKTVTSRYLGSRLAAAALRRQASELERADIPAHVADKLLQAREGGTGDVRSSAWRDLDLPIVITSEARTGSRALGQSASVRTLPLVDPRPRPASATLGAASPSKTGPLGFVCSSATFAETVRLRVPDGMSADVPKDVTKSQTLAAAGPDGPVKGRLVVTATHKRQDDSVIATRSFSADFDAPICPAAFAKPLGAALKTFEDLRSEPVRVATDKGVPSN